MLEASESNAEEPTHARVAILGALQRVDDLCGELGVVFELLVVLQLLRQMEGGLPGFVDAVAAERR